MTFCQGEVGRAPVARAARWVRHVRSLVSHKGTANATFAYVPLAADASPWAHWARCAASSSMALASAILGCRGSRAAATRTTRGTRLLGHPWRLAARWHHAHTNVEQAAARLGLQPEHARSSVIIGVHVGMKPSTHARSAPNRCSAMSAGG
jgi:hypothetical protein